MGWIISTILLSIFIVSFLLVKFLCMKVMDCKVSFSLTKLIVLFGFVGVNIWNLTELIHNNECYLKYKIRSYNMAYLGLLGGILLTLLCSLFCSKNNPQYNENWNLISCFVSNNKDSNRII